MSVYNRTLDIYQRDDTATGRRMGMRPGGTKVATAARCAVYELSARRRAAFERELMTVSHAVHFASVPKADAGGTALGLDNTYYLAFTDPDTAAARTLNVVGFKRPSHRGLPYVTLCEEVAT